MKKVLIIGGGAVVAILVVAIVALVLIVSNLNVIAKSGIEFGAEEALKVETKLESVDISLLGGQVDLKEMTISNIEGYTDPVLVHLNNFDLKADTTSLLSDTVVVNHFIIDGLKLNIETKGKDSNVQALLRKIKEVTGKDIVQEEKTEEPEEETAGSNIKVKVEKIVLKNIVGTFSIDGGKPLVVEVPNDIVLENISSEEGVSISAIVEQIMPAIMAAALKNAAGLPAELVGQLGSDIAGLAGNFGGNAAQLVANINENIGAELEKMGAEIGKVGENLGEGMKDATKGIEDAGKGLGDAAKGLGGMFGGDKEKKEATEKTEEATEEGAEKKEEEKKKNPLGGLFN